MTRIGRDERCILDNSVFNNETLLFELPLELLPDHSIRASLR